MFKNLTIMKRKKFNSWNNTPCRTIFYHVTQGSHRVALYCFYNHAELFSDDLVKRVLIFIYRYLRSQYDFECSGSGLPSDVAKFFSIIIAYNHVDACVSSFIHQYILKFYEEKN